MAVIASVDDLIRCREKGIRIVNEYRSGVIKQVFFPCGYRVKY